MRQIHPKFVVDEQDQRQAVMLSLSDWAAVLEALEELDDIRAYDAAKADSDEAIPLEDAMRELDEPS